MSAWRLDRSDQGRMGSSALLAGPATAAEGESTTESAASAEPSAVEEAPADSPPPAAEEQPPPVEEAPQQELQADPPPEAVEPEPAAEDVPTKETPAAEEPAEEPVTEEAAEKTADEAPAGKVERQVAARAAAKAVVKVEICHATGSTNNPYVSNAPSASGTLNGHMGHAGPVYVDGATEWGDIIPPFTFDGVDYPGQNYTGNAAGQAIFDNGCAVPGEVAVPLTPATAVEASATPPTCVADGALVLPVTPGVIYVQDPGGTGPGSYTITADAAVGYELTNPSFEQVIEVLPQLTGPQCIINGLSPATAVPPDTTPATCTLDGTLVLPQTVGVVYDAIPVPMTNDFIVTAAAAQGYYLTNPGFVVFVDVPDELTVGCDTLRVTRRSVTAPPATRTRTCSSRLTPLASPTVTTTSTRVRSGTRR